MPVCIDVDCTAAVRIRLTLMIDTHTRAQALMNRVRSIHLRTQTPQRQPRASGVGMAGFIPPVMDYFTAGFDYLAGNRYPEPVRQPTPPPAYEPLPPCAEGFTRSPQDGDVLVCPRCERELCVDDPTPANQITTENTSPNSKGKKAKTKEGEGREEVWVVKACGHVSALMLLSTARNVLGACAHCWQVYCGACARGRKRAPTTKLKGKTSPNGKGKEAVAATAPFSNCLIKGCDEKLSSKAHMIQLFL